MAILFFVKSDLGAPFTSLNYGVIWRNWHEQTFLQPFSNCQEPVMGSCQLWILLFIPISSHQLGETTISLIHLDISNT